MFVKFMNSLSKPKKEEKPAEAEKPEDVLLLEEIRDLLKEQPKKTEVKKTTTKKAKK